VGVRRGTQINWARSSDRAVLRAALCAWSVVAGLLVADCASATPWMEVGDAQMRSDVEVLAAAGIIDDVTTQWPLPWGGIMVSLEQADEQNLPAYLRAAAERLEAEGQRATAVDQVNYAANVDITNLPDVVRSFDGLGREDAQGSVSAEWMGNNTAIRLQVGTQTLDRYDHQALMFDDSYLTQRIGNVAVYAGYVTHWWGPGWDTALSLSNNARPFPQIGYRRLSTSAFSWPILSWLGPWNHEMFFGVFDDPRMARNTLFHAMRFEFNPFEGFSFALARLTEFCGTGEVCKPLSELTNVQNGPAYVSKSKDEANIDLRYTNMFQGFSYAVYLQVMNRDTGPFVHSDSSHVFGLTTWVPVRQTAVRFTVEYGDTISTDNIFSFGKDFYGITYTDYKYPDGWQYRGRTLGSSLDTDSRLASFHASWIGPHDLTYTLTYYRAYIDTPQTLQGYENLVGTATPPLSGNRITAAPVVIDIGEARVRVPFRNLSLEAAVRIQDDQPRPDHGFTAAGELSLTYRL